MRVLYLWNPAGALTPVADWLVENGHEARIIMSTKFDLFGNTSISPAARMVNSSQEYYQVIIQELLRFHPSIIHVNAHLQSLVLARVLHPMTPIVFQYHGSEVRYRKAVHREILLADRVLVSTPDLKQYGEWYDRPVDSRFYDRGGRVKDTAVMFHTSFFMEDLQAEAKQWCESRGIKLTILQRDKGEGVPYEEMPKYLSKFEYFLDFKGYGDPEAYSRLAIEALACGTKVVSDNDPSKILETYPFPKPERYYYLYKEIRRPTLSLKRQVVALHGLLRWARGTLYR
ncbi:MAG: hypothetical protein ACFFDQ_07730 [Candidatus Thorarchaeota archaeon]